MNVEHHSSGHISVDIPPRKLLSSSKSPSSATSRPKDHKDYCYDSDSDDPYAGDHFRMYEFKIRRCTRSRSHDWTDCPFSHPGEKARRRDPRRYHYTGEVCPEFRHGGDCSRGDECGFAHGVFECWLHPSRYRTEACKDGKHCKRKICFFAHSPRQLRVLPPPEKFISGGNGGSASMLSSKSNGCCMFCSHSPTSTLFGLTRSPSSSPPLSPANKSAVFSRLSRRRSSVAYKEVLNELINSLDSVSLTEALAVASSSSCPVTMPVSTAAMLASSSLSNHHHHRLPPWLDVGERDHQYQQSSSLQFALSPSSTPSYLHGQLQLQPPPPSFFSDEITPRGGRLSDFTAAAAAAAEARDKSGFEVGSCGDLDLGWVNDLLK
ncbi:hypothetical protein EUTSA_v10003231mg [Eutrema salsugineum]|uniref:C3H1-type domain-containing protein n=1 Tax=Eutrema salsugineum TaxID=72664 RepID=V4L2P4_EUTSA|nr:zinc finger CCCH domain-containing protein 61 [Eutrema salsugineum]ESQ44575.1 hypothetical protein EUTSA_v10003231mg [Eutrema salsugineum]